MSYARTHALAATIVWALILAGLSIVVLGNGVEQFSGEGHRIWRVIAAVIILPGFVVNAWLGWRSRSGRRRGEIDERDDAIALRASQATLIVVAVALFTTSIALYETYGDAGVPSGWLYLIAYGSAALLSMVHAAASLILDLRGTLHG